MAYRDDLETRRAHLRRLEARLAALKEEEARIRAMPGADASLLDRTLGGPKVIEREVRLSRRLDEGSLRELADETFEVDGRVAREGDVVIWRGEPEPRPRRVEVRVTPSEDGCVVRVRDQGSWRLYAGLAGFAGVLPQLFRSDAFGAIASVVALLAVVLIFASIRARAKKNTRRRMHQTELFTARAAAGDEIEGAVEARVRVDAGDARGDEDESDEGDAAAVPATAPAEAMGAR